MTTLSAKLASPKRRQLAIGLPLFACGLLIAPVQAKSDIHQFSKTMMGTRLDLTLQGADASLMKTAAVAALSEMARLADMMSRYRSDSELNAINLAAGLQAVQVSAELLEVLEMAQRVTKMSKGAFDVTVGALRDWNFDAASPSIASAQQIASQLPLIGAKGLILNARKRTAFLSQRGMRLDLGGIAKLPIMKAGMRQLLAHGVVNAMINGGGDVLVNGQLNGRDWRVGLRDPRQPDQLLGVVALNKGFVASSGDYERYVMHEGQRLHHILDPKTGYPTKGPHGVTLISDNLEAINGLGATIMVAGAQSGRTRLQQMSDVDALIVDANNQLWTSSGMARRLVRS